MRPTRIKLGDATLKVTWHTGFLESDDDYHVTDSADGDYGYCIFPDGVRLHVSERAPDVAETLLHECLHAALFRMGHHRLLEHSVEEAVISGVSSAVIELLRRNRGLGEWLVSP